MPPPDFSAAPLRRGYLNGVQGVAGSNPAVPTKKSELFGSLFFVGPPVLLCRRPSPLAWGIPVESGRPDWRNLLLSNKMEGE